MNEPEQFNVVEWHVLGSSAYLFGIEEHTQLDATRICTAMGAELATTTTLTAVEAISTQLIANHPVFSA